MSGLRSLLYRDTFPRLAADLREQPGKWLSRLVFLLGPWASFWMVEILNENDVFSDLYAWQVLMNLIWYYIWFVVCRLALGRRRRFAFWWDWSTTMCSGSGGAFCSPPI